MHSRASRRSLESAGPVVVNPSARSRGGVVEAVLPGSASSGGHPEVSGPARRVRDPEGTRRHDPRCGDGADSHRPAPEREPDQPRHLDPRCRRRPRTRPGSTSRSNSVPRSATTYRSRRSSRTSTHGSAPDLTFPSACGSTSRKWSRVLARVAPVAGFGWSAFEPAKPDHPVSAEERADEVVLTNGLAHGHSGTSGRNLRPRRPRWFRDPGGRRRSRRLLQLLTATPGPCWSAPLTRSRSRSRAPGRLKRPRRSSRPTPGLITSTA